MRYTELPWHIIKKPHINQYGYSGAVIKALRASRAMRSKDLAKLLKKRRSTVEKIEQEDKIGIALAKKLQVIFNLSDWRVLREPPKNLALLTKTTKKNKLSQSADYKEGILSAINIMLQYYNKELKDKKSLTVVEFKSIIEDVLAEIANYDATLEADILKTLD